MSSIRCSRLLACCLVAVLALSVAAPAAAVSVDAEDVPSEAEAGTQYEASVTLTDLYSDNSKWRLNASTELVEDPLWTVEYVGVDGDVTEEVTRTGQNVTVSERDVESPISEVRVTVEGEVPEVGNWSYEPRPSFLAMELAQVPVTSDGSTGAPSTIDTWTTAHYTTDSQEAREAIESATEAISSAEEAGGDVSDAENALTNAKRFYRNEDFDAAVSNAEDAQEQANDAEQSAQSSQQTQQLLLYAGVGVVVLLLIGGGVYWYRQNQQDTSRLG
ncbi:hypothetical protein [Halorubellus sp. PRR65]|uniref:hypothetical protein n=1 Tax=Halorubellus sp. PRR65 TaxID=3098148 RepID=UPI002B260CC0|nr:hypothetical protein [Halorubellus sp. PRR65]